MMTLEEYSQMLRDADHAGKPERVRLLIGDLMADLEYFREENGVGK